MSAIVVISPNDPWVAPRPTGKHCQICLSTIGPWTVEDSYPKWLRRRILDDLRSLPPDALPDRWLPGRRVLLKPVCEACQRHLNIEFEIPAHPVLKAMMDQKHAVLDLEEQRVLGRWFAKTSIVLVLSRRGDETPPPAPLEVNEHLRLDLLYMMDGNDPPPDVTVRVARLDTALLTETARAFVPHGWPKMGAFVFSSIVSTGDLAWEAVFGLRPDVTEYVAGTRFDYRFVRITPAAERRARWPQRVPLSGLDLHAWRNAWNHVKPYGGNFPPTTIGIAPRPPYLR